LIMYVPSQRELAIRLLAEIEKDDAECDGVVVLSRASGEVELVKRALQAFISGAHLVTFPKTKQ